MKNMLYFLDEAEEARQLHLICKAIKYDGKDMIYVHEGMMVG